MRFIAAAILLLALGFPSHARTALVRSGLLDDFGVFTRPVEDGLKAQELLDPERAKVPKPDIEQSGIEQPGIAQPGKLPQTSRLQTNTLNFIYSSSPFSYSDS